MAHFLIPTNDDRQAYENNKQVLELKVSVTSLFILSTQQNLLSYFSLHKP